MSIIGRLWNLGKGTWKVRRNDSSERVSDAELDAELAGLTEDVKSPAAASGATAPKEAAESGEAALPEPEKDASGKVIKTL